MEQGERSRVGARSNVEGVSRQLPGDKMRVYGKCAAAERGSTTKVHVGLCPGGVARLKSPAEGRKRAGAPGKKPSESPAVTRGAGSWENT